MINMGTNKIGTQDVLCLQRVHCIQKRGGISSSGNRQQDPSRRVNKGVFLDKIGDFFFEFQRHCHPQKKTGLLSSQARNSITKL
jgi:hypothetical protein